jgi:YD repeat-containing protein
MVSQTVLQLNTWYHYALTKQGTTFRLFINGQLETTATSAQVTDPMNVSLNIGGGFGGENFRGYIDEVRITKGVARYAASFMVPTKEHSNQLPSPSAVGYTAGDLQRVTDASGRSWNYTEYNMAGKPVTAVDPKGVVTDVVYTPRGFIGSVTETPPAGVPRVTTKSYDNSGQLTGVSMPDGTNLSFTYDAAHRLTGVTDARGNSVTYTLDGAGNRIADQVRDPTGSLQRSIARSFDALSRLQQVTGANH